MANKKNIAHYTSLKKLKNMGFLEADYKNQIFSKHCHEGYTVGVIEKGTQGFYRTGSEHQAPTRTIILVNSDDVHSGYALSEGGWAYRAVYPIPALFEDISCALGINKHGAPYFPNAVITDTQLANHLIHLFNVLSSNQSALYKETLVYSVLAHLMLKHGKSTPEIKPVLANEKSLLLIKEFIDDNPATNISLEDLAKYAAISPFQLVRAFHKKFGLPPHAYQIQVRLRLAKKLLRQNMSITQAAIAAGFHDQSHFYRHFKKNMGVTPKQFLSK